MQNNGVAVSGDGASETEFASLIAHMENSAAIEFRLAALAAVRDGVITGEGPTTAGRIHFSRCIDAADTAWVRRILLVEGMAPVTRAEADALFDIHEAAIERIDGGAFDRLFATAIAHHVLAALRLPVVARAIALDTGIADWTRPVALDGETATWLKTRLSRKRRYDGPIAMLAAWVGASVSTLASDLAA